MVTTPLTDTVGGDLPLRLGGEAVTTSKLNPDFDVFLSGLQLNLHITKDTPYARQTADWRKQQIDQEPEAGEQSLSDWWLRSQMTFQLGAGLKYLDTTIEQGSTNRARFDDCRGVDVWTPGMVKRLPDTALALTVTGTPMLASTIVAGANYLLVASGAQLRALTPTGTINYTTGTTNTIKAFACDGTSYYVASSDGVFKGPVDNSAGGAKVYDLPSTATVVLGWVKSRLMAGVDNKVYELAAPGPTLPTALYSHPNTGWRWTAFADSPQQVVAGGAAGLYSAVFGFALDDSTGAPILGPGVSLAELPVGETVTSLYLYLGSMLGIGTTKGLRVGQFNNYYGTFSYGPLTVDTALGLLGPVTALAGRGAFLYCGCTVGGESMLVRVDLGAQTAENVYAWAPDLRPPTEGVTGKVTGITVDSDGLIAFAVQSAAVYREQTTRNSPRPAWMRTGRIRMNTVEPKQFKYGRVRTEGIGTITVNASTNLIGDRQVFTVPTDRDSERFALLAGPAEWVQLTFTLTGAAVLTSYQVLALPAQPRSRLFSMPVALFDSEVNRNGKKVGYPGRAKAYLDALEVVESSGDELIVQCPALGIDATRCVIERIEFQQGSAPTGNRKQDLGGYANLVFRTST